jgi:hypothetical protein
MEHTRPTSAPKARANPRPPPTAIPLAKAPEEIAHERIPQVIVRGTQPPLQLRLQPLPDLVNVTTTTDF